MNFLLKYKNYKAIVFYSDEDRCYVGEVVSFNNQDIYDLILLEGDNYKEIKKSFYGMIDDYIDFLNEKDWTPDGVDR